MEKPRIGCVVMAAGSASRFGTNKLAAQIDGKTLLCRALEAVPPACFAQVVVVTQHPEAAEAARRFSFTPVENQHPDWGISHTISLGLDALQDCDAALFLVSDQPLLRQASVAELVDFYRRHPSHIVALGHNGVRGNPCRAFPGAGSAVRTAGAPSVSIHFPQVISPQVIFPQVIFPQAAAPLRPVFYFFLA